MWPAGSHSAWVKELAVGGMAGGAVRLAESMHARESR